eukprot:scaffold136178_cov178-Phaeocystis_antarctica.AAC.1
MVRLSQAVTIVNVCVFGALPDCMHRDADTPAWACAVRARGVLCTNAFSGSESARHLGPTPRGRLKLGRICLRAGPELLRTVKWRSRASVCNRAVECRFRPRDIARRPPSPARERVPWGRAESGWRAAGSDSCGAWPSPREGAHPPGLRASAKPTLSRRDGAQAPTRRSRPDGTEPPRRRAAAGTPKRHACPGTARSRQGGARARTARHSREGAPQPGRRAISQDGARPPARRARAKAAQPPSRRVATDTAAR